MCCSPLRAQNVPDAGIEEVISSGTGEQGMEGEAMIQQLVVDKDPQKYREIKLQEDMSRDPGTSFVLSKY